MARNGPVYVIFDGDNDKWAYAYMKGWKANKNIDFEFKDAHDLDNMTGFAQNEAYVKGHLRERLQNSSAAIVVVGEKTKNLYKYVRWEIEMAIDLDLPIIVVNLNNTRTQDPTLCPPLLRDVCAVHVSFELKIIRHALENWPTEFRGLNSKDRAGGYRYYQASVYG